MIESFAVMNGITKSAERWFTVGPTWCRRHAILPVLASCLVAGSVTYSGHAQENPAVSSSTNSALNEMAKQISELRALVLQLQAQVKELQAPPKVVQTAASSSDGQPAFVEGTPTDTRMNCLDLSSRLRKASAGP